MSTIRRFDNQLGVDFDIKSDNIASTSTETLETGMLDADRPTVRYRFLSSPKPSWKVTSDVMEPDAKSSSRSGQPLVLPSRARKARASQPPGMVSGPDRRAKKSVRSLMEEVTRSDLQARQSSCSQK